MGIHSSVVERKESSILGGPITMAAPKTSLAPSPNTGLPYMEASWGYQAKFLEIGTLLKSRSPKLGD